MFTMFSYYPITLYYNYYIINIVSIFVTIIININIVIITIICFSITIY